MGIELRGLRAIVTGAAGGLGGGICRELIAAGASVAVAELTPERAEEAAARLGATSSVSGDVADESQVEALVERAVGSLGGLDLLVNNAGVLGEFAATVRQDAGRWQRVMDVHVRGTFLMSRAAGRILVAQGSGSVVNLSSVAGLVAMPSSNDYSVAKAAIAMMTRTMATEWARKGVRVNAIAPGSIDAGMLDELVTTTPLTREGYLSLVPMARFGEAEDIGRAVVFLASDMARYITGVVLPVDGGWSASAASR